ncbi:MAG TPA: DUF2269 family protein [Thermoleophilaceae bacterium]|jgi:uncharacterized membrane protein
MLTTYTVLLTVHITAAAVWVGGGIMLQILAARARRARDNPARLADVVRDIAHVAPRTFIPASLVLVGTGFWMIYDFGWSYDLWVILAIVGWAVTFLTGNLLLGPTSQKATKGLDENGPTDPPTLKVIDRLLSAVRVDQAVLILVIVDMVVKPT